MRVRSASAAAQRCSLERQRQRRPSPRSSRPPSTVSISSSVSTLRPGTASPSGSASSSRSSTARSSNSRMKSRRAPRSGSRVHRRRQVDPGLDVVLERRQVLRHAGVVGVLGQVLLAFGAGDLVDACQHLLQRAELLQQLGRGFLADPRDAGDVVGGVAAQAHQVGDQLRRHPVALFDRGAVVDLRLGDPARGAHHPHPVADQLVGVAVAGDDHHLDPLLARLSRQRGDHVVGLEAVDLDVGVAEGLDQRHQVRPLLAQQVRARFALGLVEVVGDLAPGHPRVPGDDDALRDGARR